VISSVDLEKESLREPEMEDRGLYFCLFLIMPELWFGYEISSKAHVLKDWFPMQQCSEVGSLGGD
jgi:hypothetical protein